MESGKRDNKERIEDLEKKVKRLEQAIGVLAKAASGVDSDEILKIMQDNNGNASV